MNVDKAYILGLVIGGGIWGNSEDVFRIKLPYKQWGSYEKEPHRAGQISGDIMRVVSPMFRNIYDISVSYDTSVSGEWNVLCEGDLSELTADLERYGIECEGEIRKNASIEKLVPDLIDDNLKRRFIAGLADTIGSTKNSHRRFTDEKQIISFEIAGFRFDFVCSLCRLLYSINCFPDQILWNHPNFHCTLNPYDMKWKKGFKLRVLLDQYDEFGAFAFTSKAESAVQNKGLQRNKNIAEPCETKKVHITPSCVHTDEGSLLLPENIRGGHYLHNKHVCAVMNCPHAPYNIVNEFINSAELYINPFPILVKNTADEIWRIVKQYPLYKNRTYRDVDIKIADIYNQYKSDIKQLLFGNKENSGYPINVLLSAITYVIAANSGEVKGTRPKGNMASVLDRHLSINSNARVNLQLPDLLTPAIITSGDYAALVGPNNPELYKKLIVRDIDNPYKISVRQISEDDFLEY
jgi:hypothetical protein